MMAARRVGVAEHLPHSLFPGRLVLVIGQADLRGLGWHVVQGDHLAVAPAGLDGQHARVTDVEYAPLARPSSGLSRRTRLAWATQEYSEPGSWRWSATLTAR
jgi:hypothetical protein